MGIAGLLPLLKSLADPTHISAYAGKTVGIDAYAWLHRGGHQCATELALHQPTDRHLQFCIARLRLLRQHNVKALLVFDGGRLPEKRRTEEERSARRRRERALGLELYEAGQKTAALKAFQRCVAITPVMAYQLMRLVHGMEGVQCLVAPYEADAQLCYLSTSGAVHAVISEDSDLLVFGCARVLYKMDASGNGEEIRIGGLRGNSEPSFTSFTHSQFQQMAVMAGCDYLPSLPSLGLRKAHALMRSCRQWDRAVRKLRLDGRVTVYDGYEADFRCALLCFNHQRVFCPQQRRLVHLRPLDNATRDAFACLDFLGPQLPDDVAVGIAAGELHPETHRPFTDDDMRGVSIRSEETAGALRCLPSETAEDVGAEAETIAEEEARQLAAGRVSLRGVRNRAAEVISLLSRNGIGGYHVSASQASRSGFVRPRSSSSGSGRAQQRQRLLTPNYFSAFEHGASERKATMAAEEVETEPTNESEGAEEEERKDSEAEAEPQPEDGDEDRGSDDSDGERGDSHAELLTHAYSLPLRPLLAVSDELETASSLLPPDIDFLHHRPLLPVPSCTFATPPPQSSPRSALCAAREAASPFVSPSPSPSPSPPLPPVSSPVFSMYLQGPSVRHRSVDEAQPEPLAVDLTRLDDEDEGEDALQSSCGSDDDKENVAALSQPQEADDGQDDIEEDDEQPPAVAAAISPFFPFSPPSALRQHFPLSAPAPSSSAVLLPREADRRVSLPIVRVSGAVQLRKSVSAVFARFESGAEAAAETGREPAESTEKLAKPALAETPRKRRSEQQLGATAAQGRGQRPRRERPQQQLEVTSVDDDELLEVTDARQASADAASFFDRFRHSSVRADRRSPPHVRLPPPPLASYAQPYARAARQFTI